MANDSDPDISINLPMLSKLGKMKFGPGIMGRSIWIVAAFLVFGATMAALFQQVIWLGATFAMVALISAVYFLNRAFAHVEKNPLHALLESTELVQALQIERQAAGDVSIIGSNVVAEQKTDKLIGSSSRDEGDPNE